MITLNIEVQSSRGLVRKKNEDMILVSTKMIRDSSLMTKVLLNDNDRYIIAVADGIGGNQSGEVASEIVSFDIASFFKTLPSGLAFGDLKSFFKSWIEKENDKLIVRGDEDENLRGMGTTMVCLIVYETKVFWLNCGDSRIYRFRKGFLVQLSTDHSLAEMTGIKRYSNVICNSIGAGASAFFDMEDISMCVFNGDTFLLCSDGLSNMLPDDKLERLLNEKESVSEFVHNAYDAGGKDNISICLIHFELK